MHRPLEKLEELRKLNPTEGAVAQEVQRAAVMGEVERTKPLIDAVAQIIDASDRQGHKRKDFAFRSGKCKCRWCAAMVELDTYRQGVRE